MEEYLALLKTIDGFDQRLLIIKGWAITFSFATLVFAIQKKKAILLLIVALSSICFWILEGETKYYQTKYYFRMRAIEILSANSIYDEVNKEYILKNENIDKNLVVDNIKKEVNNIKTVLTDWTWENPDKALTDKIKMREPISRLDTYIYNNVINPHLVILLLCGVLIINKKKWT